MGHPKHNAAQIAAGAERREYVLRLRSQGWTFQRIGAELGVSATRAMQIHNRAVRLHRDNPQIEATAVTPETPVFMLPLSLRAENALRHGGYKTFADFLPFDDAKVEELLKVPNFGRSCLKELGLIVSRATLSVSATSHQHKRVIM